MSDFVAVAQVADFPNPGRQMFEIDDRIVVLLRVGDAFYCLDDVCTHDGGPLADGKFCEQDFTLACPRHGAKFDIRTGQALTMPATENTHTHEVKLEQGQVWVKLRPE
jgi:3-phenylpropionate/trans-cinnamate dioxygenase ferredoxin subunit